MLNRPDANAYNRRQSSRLTVTTIEAITIVAASSVGKFPVSVARLITAPNPVVVKVCPWKWKYSATILAFHAPPEAVTKPVIRYGKIPGRSNLRQRSNAAKAIHVADLFKVRRDGRCAGDDIEEDVPLRTHQQQDD